MEKPLDFEKYEQLSDEEIVGIVRTAIEAAKKVNQLDDSSINMFKNQILGISIQTLMDERIKAMEEDKKESKEVPVLEGNRLSSKIFEVILNEYSNRIDKLVGKANHIYGDLVRILPNPSESLGQYDMSFKAPIKEKAAAISRLSWLETHRKLINEVKDGQFNPDDLKRALDSDVFAFDNRAKGILLELNELIRENQYVYFKLCPDMNRIINGIIKIYNERLNKIAEIKQEILSNNLRSLVRGHAIESGKNKNDHPVLVEFRNRLENPKTVIFDGPNGTISLKCHSYLNLPCFIRDYNPLLTGVDISVINEIEEKIKDILSEIKSYSINKFGEYAIEQMDVTDEEEQSFEHKVYEYLESARHANDDNKKK